MNLLVTGGCGFIGSNFINYIFDRLPDSSITNVDKLILNSNANYVDERVQNSDRYKLVLTDVGNSVVVGKTLQNGNIDTIVHFASDCTSTRCYSNPEETVDNNVFSTISFLDAVLEYHRVEPRGRIKRFIHISTDEVYGDSEMGNMALPRKEEEMLQPGNPYAASKVQIYYNFEGVKAACEAYVKLYQQEFALPITILRINNIYGPNQWDVKLVPRFVEVARRGGRFPVQGSGKQLRSWLFVDDASEGILSAIAMGAVGEVYNLGTYFEANVVDLAHMIQKEVDAQLGRPAGTVEFDSVPDRPYNDQRYLIDIAKAKQQLGWEPTTPFGEGLRRVICSHLKASTKEAKRMSMSVAIYGGKGWIGQQVQKMLDERGVPYQLAECRVGRDDNEKVLYRGDTAAVVLDGDHYLDTSSSQGGGRVKVVQELIGIGATHVLCCTGRTHGGAYKTIEYLEGGPEKAHENIRDNLYCPVALAEICHRLRMHYTYVGTGYLFAYDNGDHTVGGKGFLEVDLPTFFGNSYSVVKGFTDRMLNQLGYTETINARITLPLNFALDEDRNLLSKIITYKQIFDVPVSITIIPDCFPALIQLMAQRYEGALNLVNPKPISLHQILQLYKELVDKHLHDYDTITVDSEKGRQIMATKGNCALDTGLLKALYPTIPDSDQALRDNFAKLSQRA